MDEMDIAVEVGRQALYLTLKISLPLLVIGLVVGLAISIIQAVTQIQEQTLTFVPKIAAMVVAASIFIPWITERMVTFTQEMLGAPPW